MENRARKLDTPLHIVVTPTRQQVENANRKKAELLVDRIEGKALMMIEKTAGAIGFACEFVAFVVIGSTVGTCIKLACRVMRNAVTQPTP